MKESWPMRQEDLDEYLKREPFQSFRIYLSTGVFFEIRQSELASTSRSTLSLGLSIEEDKQRFVEIALIHIVWMEVLLPAL
jgi:hypothetical protein